MARDVSRASGATETTEGGSNRTTVSDENVAGVEGETSAAGPVESTNPIIDFSAPAFGVVNQKPHKSLDQFDWKSFPFLDGRRVATSDDGKSVTIFGDSREEALRVASNVIA